MKYIKLFFISVFIFGLMLFCISLLFPKDTIVSRAVNVGDDKPSWKTKLPQLHQIAFGSTVIDIPLTNSDTLLTTASFASNIQQGTAVYQTASDSTVIQVFYKIHVPTYKFWDKFGLMLNEVKYGPLLDSAISRIKEKF